MIGRGFVWSLVAVAVLLVPSPTLRAESLDPQERFNKALEAATAEEYDKAIAIGLEVLPEFAVKDRPRANKLLGYVYMKLDALPEAWHHLTRYLNSGNASDEVVLEWVREVETKLKETHVRVSLECNPSSTVLGLPASKEGLAVQSGYSPTSLALDWWFKPGIRKIQAMADGHEPKDVEIRPDTPIGSGSGTIHIVLKPVSMEVVETPARVPTKIIANSQPVVVPVIDVSRVQARRPTRALEWTLIASGLAMSAAGGAMYTAGYFENESLYKKHNDPQRYPDPARATAAYRNARKDKVEPMEISAYALFGVGGAALVSGIVTFVTRKPKSALRAEAPVVSPFIVPGGTGALMTIEF